MNKKITLTKKTSETSDVVSFQFEPEEQTTWKAGQYMEIVVPHDNPDDKGIERFFTISAAPFEKHLQLTTRLTGSTFKNALNALPIGSKLTVTELEGSFTLEDPAGEYVFIAGGIGITPFRSILQQLTHENKPFKIQLLYGNRTEDFVFKKELEEIAAKNPDFKINYLTAPETINADTIRAYVPDLSKPTFYISGPEPMVEAIEKIFLEELDVPKDKLKLDYFPGYDEKNY